MRYLLLALLAFVGYTLFRRFTRAQPHAPTVRRENAELGLEVMEVSRALPVTAIGGRSYRLQDGRCIRYRLPNHAPGAPRFQLLQRAGTEAAGLAAGWQLVLERGDAPPRLLAELARITSEWTEDYLEFEGDEQGICAYWHEQRGQTSVGQVHGYLTAIADAIR